MFPRELREQARDAWISGKFASLAELQRHFKIAKLSTIYGWRKRDKWDELAKRVQDRVLDLQADTYAQRAAQVSEHFWRLWNLVLAKLTERVRDAEQDGRRLTISELEIMTRVLERAQRGEEMSVAAGRPPSEQATQEIIIQYQSLAEAIKIRQAGNGGERQTEPVEADGGDGKGGDDAM